MQRPAFDLQTEYVTQLSKNYLLPDKPVSIYEWNIDVVWKMYESNEIQWNSTFGFSQCKKIFLHCEKCNWLICFKGKVRDCKTCVQAHWCKF